MKGTHFNIKALTQPLGTSFREELNRPGEIQSSKLIGRAALPGPRLVSQPLPASKSRS